MLFLTLSEGPAADETHPLLASCDQRLIAAVIRELGALAQGDSDNDLPAKAPPGPMPASSGSKKSR